MTRRRGEHVIASGARKHFRFAGKRIYERSVAYIEVSHMARTVRFNIGRMYDRDSPTDGWTAAKNYGWRVVKVEIRET